MADVNVTIQFRASFPTSEALGVLLDEIEGFINERGKGALLPDGYTGHYVNVSTERAGS